MDAKTCRLINQLQTCIKRLDKKAEILENQITFVQKIRSGKLTNNVLTFHNPDNIVHYLSEGPNKIHGFVNSLNFSNNINKLNKPPLVSLVIEHNNSNINRLRIEKAIRINLISSLHDSHNRIATYNVTINDIPYTYNGNVLSTNKDINSQLDFGSGYLLINNVDARDYADVLNAQQQCLCPDDEPTGTLNEAIDVSNDIEYVIVILFENRAFDTVFGQYLADPTVIAEYNNRGYKAYNPVFDKVDTFYDTIENDMVGCNTCPGQPHILLDDNGNKIVKRQSNINVDDTYYTWTDTDFDRTNDMPVLDPGEQFLELNQQVFGINVGDSVPTSTDTATMNGFATNYILLNAWDLLMDTGNKQELVTKQLGCMFQYSPEQINPFIALAKEYAICDCWFSPAPCQTWLNRIWMQSGHCYGYVNNSPESYSTPNDTVSVPFPSLNPINDVKFLAYVTDLLRRILQFDGPTVFSEMADQIGEESFRIYYDFPAPLTFLMGQNRQFIGGSGDNFKPYSEFETDLANDDLRQFTFIEPRYVAIPNGTTANDQMPNDMHPPHDVRFSQRLAADIYNKVRASQAWADGKVLMIYTFDEGVGMFDHVIPPNALDPNTGYVDDLVDQTSTTDFRFTRYGTRIPAILISPLIRPYSILRTDDIPNNPDITIPFDHTCILKTVNDLFLDGSTGFLSSPGPNGRLPFVPTLLNSPIYMPKSEIDQNRLPNIPLPDINATQDDVNQSLADVGTRSTTHNSWTLLKALCKLQLVVDDIATYFPDFDETEIATLINQYVTLLGGEANCTYFQND